VPERVCWFKSSPQHTGPSSRKTQILAMSTMRHFFEHGMSCVVESRKGKPGPSGQSCTKCKPANAAKTILYPDNTPVDDCGPLPYNTRGQGMESPFPTAFFEG